MKHGLPAADAEKPSSVEDDFTSAGDRRMGVCSAGEVGRLGEVGSLGEVGRL